MSIHSDPAHKILDHAQVLLSRGDANGALDALDLGLSVQPAHQGLAQRKLELLRQMKRHSEAWSFGRSLPAGAKNAPILALLVHIALALNEVDAAHSLLREVEASNMDRSGYLLLASKVAEQCEGAGAAVLLLEELGSDIANRPKLMREYARLLVKLGRADEALNRLEEVVDRAPVPLLVLSLIKLEFASGRYDRVDILVSKHADLAEAHPDLRILAVRAADQQGDLPLALSRVEAAVLRFPDHRELNEAYWRLLSRSGRQRNAIEACLAFARSKPLHLASQLCSIRFLHSMKEEEACDTLIEQVRRLEPKNVDVLQIRAQVLLSRDDAMGALELLSNIHDSPTSPPSIQILLAKTEKALGYYSQAISRLENVVSDFPRHQQAKLALAQLFVLLGLVDRAQDLLENIPGGSSRLARSRWEVLSDIALQKGNLSEALNAIERAGSCDSTNGGIWRKRSQIQLFLGKTEDAWNSHLQALKLRSRNDVSGRSNTKARRSIPGQIMNEYRLSQPNEIQRYSASGTDQRDAMRYFRACVVNNPQSTSSALCLLGAIQRSGLIVDSPMKKLSEEKSSKIIPKKLFQYWDSKEIPDQVAGVMNENQILNPDFTYKKFNEAEARSYLREKGESEALRSFQIAPHAAAKADIFRLAVLWHEGGIFLDADDRCLNPLHTFIDLGCRFVGYQEKMMSVGNNFLAVRPKDPIIRDALQSATVAFSATQGESIWLSTGPGAITRAVALHGTGDDGSLCKGVWIMPMYRLRREIALHTRLSYKSTEKNWFETLKSV